MIFVFSYVLLVTVTSILTVQLVKLRLTVQSLENSVRNLEKKEIKNMQQKTLLIKRVDFIENSLDILFNAYANQDEDDEQTLNDHSFYYIKKLDDMWNKSPDILPYKPNEDFGKNEDTKGV